MMVSRKILNFRKAKNSLSYPNTLYSKQFSKYSPAYVVTNENLRVVTGLTNLDGAKVLTAAGSGDHPIFYSLAGARKVDTFDISFCAKAIMDIKTSAISVLDYEKYKVLINSLYKTEQVSKAPHFSEINLSLPNATSIFLNKMDGFFPFCCGLHPSNYADYMPTYNEYCELKDNINKPFNFIWSDLTKVHKHLNKDYDVINLSNIFQYVKNAEQISRILKNLDKYLSPNGKIITETNWFVDSEKYFQVQNHIKEWATIKLIKFKGQESVLLEKTK